jgi:glutamine synthetase
MFDGVDLVRCVFADTHGVLRGKTVSREAFFSRGTSREPISAPGSLLLKDTSGKTVYGIFAGGPGLPTGFAGAADVVLVPDEATFRVLPWATRTGWVLCDLTFPSGEPVPLSPREILRRQLADAEARGYRMTAGAELEFHVYRDSADGSGAGRPGAGPEPVTPDMQLLREESLDEVDGLVWSLSSGLQELGLPLRTIEAEFGAGQLEVTLSATDAAVTADQVMLCRTAVRQIARRLGYTATFMARPAGASVSAGWHLHQSLTCATDSRPAFMPCGAAPGEVLSPTGASYAEGLLRHAPAAAAFAVPTVNGYKRFQPLSLAPDRIGWGVQNRGCLVRVIGGPGNTATRLENRCGEPAANPYLYLASQLACGMAGIADKLELRPELGSPYGSPGVSGAERLPVSLGEAITALNASPVLRAALTDEVVDWYVTLKRHEFARYLAHVSDWEQAEYLGLF